MLRYLLVFSGLLVISLAMMAGLLARSGYSLFEPEMRMMLLVCVLVAAYVGWRITTVLGRRRAGKADQAEGGGLFAGLLRGTGHTQSARLARVAARRRKLVAEGRLEANAADMAGEADRAQPPAARVASSASVREKMAARAERVRRAREEGRL